MVRRNRHYFPVGEEVTNKGATLRQQYAGMFAKELLSRYGKDGWDAKKIAEVAVEVADALIEVEERNHDAGA